MRAALEDLFPENARAWMTFHQCVTRFTVDCHLGGLALDRLTTELSTEEYGDLLDRLTVLYDIFCPAPPPRT